MQNIYIILIVVVVIVLALGLGLGLGLKKDSHKKKNYRIGMSMNALVGTYGKEGIQNYPSKGANKVLSSIPNASWILRTSNKKIIANDEWNNDLYWINPDLSNSTSYHINNNTKLQGPVHLLEYNKYIYVSCYGGSKTDSKTQLPVPVNGGYFRFKTGEEPHNGQMAMDVHSMPGSRIHFIHSFTPSNKSNSILIAIDLGRNKIWDISNFSKPRNISNNLFGHDHPRHFVQIPKTNKIVVITESDYPRSKTPSPKLYLLAFNSRLHKFELIYKLVLDDKKINKYATGDEIQFYNKSIYITLRTYDKPFSPWVNAANPGTLSTGGLFMRIDMNSAKSELIVKSRVDIGPSPRYFCILSNEAYICCQGNTFIPGSVIQVNIIDNSIRSQINYEGTFVRDFERQLGPAFFYPFTDHNLFLTQFSAGVNLAGFDWGLWGGTNQDTTCIPNNHKPQWQRPGLSYYPISNKAIDWNYNNGNGSIVIRFPITPTRIFCSRKPGIPDFSKGLLAIFTGEKTTQKKCLECDNKKAHLEASNDIPNISNDQMPALPIPPDAYSAIGNYMSAIRYANKLGIYSIIDLHDDTRCLYTFGETILSPNNFAKMWEKIAEYICRQKGLNQDLILFELFNEPIPTNHAWYKDNICGYNGPTQPPGVAPNPATGRPAKSCDNYKQIKSPHYYNKYYQIKAIKAIRRMEKKYKCGKHIILATTYGNWSGVHAWNHTNLCKNPNSITTRGPCDKNAPVPSPSSPVCGYNYCSDCEEYFPDNPLQELIRDLENADFTPDSNIIISGHQYCDANYSGLGWKPWLKNGQWGCDKACFTEKNMTLWLTETQSSLKSKKNPGKTWKWFQTEGTVPCKPPTIPAPSGSGTISHNGDCENWNLYTSWLNKLYNNPCCLGFTLWNSNVMQFQQNSLGSNSSNLPNKKNPFSYYTKIFTNDGKAYTWNQGTTQGGNYNANGYS